MITKTEISCTEKQYDYIKYLITKPRGLIIAKKHKIINEKGKLKSRNELTCSEMRKVISELVNNSKTVFN